MSAIARAAAACAAILGMVLAGGCASQASNPGSTHTTAVADPGPAHATAEVDHAVVVLDEHANNTTVRIVAGVDIELQLHSTYWMNFASSRSSVVHEDGAPSVKPARSHCVPGGGCGLEQSTFRAVHVGTAVLTASRTTCGEALACGPGNSHYRVTIHVVAH
jgi:hypothetical protein